MRNKHFLINKKLSQDLNCRTLMYSKIAAITENDRVAIFALAVIANVASRILWR